eukprot:SAG22_NODE_590_length_8826_cov_6.627134_5_plen_78_part_00
MIILHVTNSELSPAIFFKKKMQEKRFVLCQRLVTVVQFPGWTFTLPCACPAHACPTIVGALSAACMTVQLSTRLSCQ